LDIAALLRIDSGSRIVWVIGESGNQVRLEAVKYWLNVVSREHVLAGREGGFTQAQHGSPAGLRRLQRGDLLVFYSPRTALQGEPLRRFTALGRIVDDETYQVEMTPSFQPWRRRVAFVDCAEAPIEPLIPGLEFIPDKQRWGFPLRRGLLELSRSDFATIASAMSVSIDTLEGDTLEGS